MFFENWLTTIEIRVVSVLVQVFGKHWTLRIVAKRDVAVLAFYVTLFVVFHKTPRSPQISIGVSAILFHFVQVVFWETIFGKFRVFRKISLVEDFFALLVPFQAFTVWNYRGRLCLYTVQTNLKPLYCGALHIPYRDQLIGILWMNKGAKRNFRRSNRRS